MRCSTMESSMRYRKSIRISYSIKNEEGYVVERRQKFSTMSEAILLLHALKSSRLVGRPIIEEK